MVKNGRDDMLEIKNITKIYETDGFKQKALDSISVSFRENEFAAILGPSGSGKTTFLNIIGGLDHYTSGDLIIDRISTKKYRDSDWDSYRNHRIGFVFQSYNLITHQSILSNVMLALTLSGVSKKESVKRAKKALSDVGLSEHIYKRPNQLSGGQMQRVAIARALVNNPDILLADEPTGALDSNTSVQIMDLLKDIAKDKLVIMVTHNPDLAKEYASRIITLKDGKITSDTNPYDGKEEKQEDVDINKDKTKKTKMSLLTALSLSFNNLMTKKGRTILVAIAGSIGIIGIALIKSLSNGFQDYVDKIGEDTLTSYPLNIMQESRDITSTLLSLTSPAHKDTNFDGVEEEQYISSMLKNISTNDLKSFKQNIEDNYEKIKADLSTVQYHYSVEPYIYTIDATKKIVKLNPSNTFSSMFNSNVMSTYSSMSSVYQEMMDNFDLLNESYDIVKGRWPKNYDEMIIVLSEKNTISDLLVYSLGLRDTEELTEMINKIMKGETIDKVNEPLKLSYDDLLGIDLRLIMSADMYKYNSKYDLYEDMSENSEYLKRMYDNALRLKIVGIVTPKDGTTSMALSPGVCYTKELTKYLINYAKNTKIVQSQQKKEEIDVFSGSKFDAKKNDLNLDFKDLITVDSDKLSSAFNVKIDQKDIENKTKSYMQDISRSITTNTDPARDMFKNNLVLLIDEMLNGKDSILPSETDVVVQNYLDTSSVKTILKEIEKEYVIPISTLKTTYQGLLKGFLQAYIGAYTFIDASIMNQDNPVIPVTTELLSNVKESYLNSQMIMGAISMMAKAMTEAKMNKEILSSVGELTGSLAKSFGNAFNVDPSKISDSFKLKMTEEEITRIITAMMTTNETNAETNLIKLGFQELDKPTYISFYFNSFDGKEHFMNYIDDYNKVVPEDKRINYSDTTGILMNSVKTIVNAVSYVLIAFVSISLIVSSFMIGIITYISVFERTKEIGILRSIGASKRNISTIFNAETFIIGLLSGLFGIGISYMFIPIINFVIHHFTGNIPLSASLYVKNAIVLVVLSIILTLIGGIIPSRSASKKDPVEALRSE